LQIKKSIKTYLLIFLLTLIVLSISVTAYLAIDSIVIGGKNAEQITSEALRSQAEKLLTQLTITSAEHNDMILDNVRLDAGTVAAYAQNIFENPETFARGTYWKFDDHILMGAGGQHLNGMDDVSSVFIPNYVNIDDVREEMELNAYLDYVFPKILENNPDAVAIWMLGLQGEARYYPNIGLGNILPPDTNSTKEIFFTPATPKNDPERNVTWSILYDDPAGQGLMITAIAPIYTKQRGFVGVIGIDVALGGIVKNIEEYNPIELSHSFLIDGQGYSIALPEHVYEEILGRTLEQNESRVNLNNISGEFSYVVEKMREGSTGFMYMAMGNEEHYVAYAPLKNAGFSLCTIIEKESLLKVIDDLHQEVADSTQNMIYGRILPFGILVTLLSFVIGFVILDRKIKPLKKLTKAAEELSKGNFAIQADVTSNDEIGQLASSFNKMVFDLKQSRKQLIESQGELEKTVLKRTSELQQKIDELEKYKKLTVGREMKMVELKNRMAELEEKLKREM